MHISLANTCSFTSGTSSLHTSKKAVDMVVTHIEASDHLLYIALICFDCIHTDKIQEVQCQ